jgi:hypothetical protein
VPFAGGLPPLTGVSIGGVTYDYVFTSGTYSTPTISGKAIVIGNAMINVTGSMNCDLFRVQSNSTVVLYCGGNVAFKDSDNRNQRASNFQIMGLKTCKVVDLDNEFMGSVYAPYASLTLTGSKAIFGSIAADTIILKGGSDVHYDEALADPTSGGATDGFIILSWTEL